MRIKTHGSGAFLMPVTVKRRIEGGGNSAILSAASPPRARGRMETQSDAGHWSSQRNQKLQPYSNVKVCIEKTRQDDAAMKNVISVKKAERFFPVRNSNEEKSPNRQKTSSKSGETNVEVIYCY